MSEIYVPAHYRRRPAGEGAQAVTEQQPAAPPPEPGAAPPPQQGGGGWMTQQSIRGVPNWALIAVVALVAVGGFLWWRSRQSAKTAAAQQQAATAQAPVTGTTQGNCYDQSGNTVPCSQADYADQIAALQAEIDSMNGQASVPATYPPQTTTPTASAAPVQPATTAAATTAGGAG
jgi:uncharacterized protein HemX